jgi:sugar phosphate isomerase/epimerase
MRLGIFAKTFVRPTLEATLDAVRDHGLDCVQFNMACAGLPSLPYEIKPKLCHHIRNAMAARGITMAAVSGTFNMAHPDPKELLEGLNRLRLLASECGRIGTSVITLCTGSRDLDNMWRRHPDNDKPEVWQDLIAFMRRVARMAEVQKVTLAIEPEVNNVVDSAAKARRLLDEIGSPWLKVVIDAANLFHPGQLRRMRAVLDEAFTLLGRDIVLAHAKDLSRDGEAGHAAPGQGVLDFDHYLALLRAAGYDGPLIIHGLDESQVDASVRFLRSKLERLSPRGSR